MIVVIDYGMGNVGSVVNMLRKVGAEVSLSGELAAVQRADKLILPGVGAFDAGMTRLRESGLVEPLTRKVLVERTPILGICLGVQLFGRGSEEGQLPGLGWVAADTRRMQPRGPEGPLRVPHMGWNMLRPAREHPLLDGLEPDARFYFVHSYHVCCERPQDVLARVDYGGEWTAALASGNILGTQFHPEKSHRFGLRVMANFAGM